MSLLLATQVTAIATGLLAAGAIVTAVYAVRAFRAQSSEVATLQQQAARDIEDRHRAQASRVFAWTDQRTTAGAGDLRAAACLTNTSGQPVYDVRLGWGDTAYKTWAVLLPGCEHDIRGAGSAVADGTAMVWAEFRDAAGNRWRVTSKPKFRAPSASGGGCPAIMT